LRLSAAEFLAWQFSDRQSPISTVLAMRTKLSCYHFGVARWWTPLVVGCWLAASTLFAQDAVAASTILSTGFENPYVPGALQGQPTNPPKWVASGNSSTATIQSSVVQSGLQAVRVDKAPGTPSVSTDRRWAVPVSGYPTQRFVIVDWDMRVSQPTNLTAFGPFFGVESYDADASAHLLGSLGVDATTGDVLYQHQGDGFLTETGTVVSFNQWHHYRLVLDFAGSTPDTYRGYVDGALVASTGFVDRAFGLDNFTDADITTFAAAGDTVSTGLAASAFFDNFVVRDGLLGDYDFDGDVDNADYTRWRTTFGNNVSPSGNVADGNANGKVDGADYVIWRHNFGANLASGSGVGSTLIPEPQNWVPLLSAGPIVCFAVRRRRGRSRQR
jgi:hypothetical protein